MGSCLNFGPGMGQLFDLLKTKDQNCFKENSFGSYLNF